MLFFLGKERICISFFAFFILVALLAGADAPGADATDGLRTVKTTLIDPDTHLFGTYQSHNQKVVANANGIFITYIHYLADPEGTNIWRLARSTDGGESFCTVYEGHFGSRAPAIESDENNNIYLAFPDWTSTDGKFCFMRFLAGEEYQTPHETNVTGAYCAAKYAMAYDRTRRRFYIATQYGAFFTVDMDGAVIDKVRAIWTHGEGVNAQYPYLHVDDAGTLYFADTNFDDKVYRSIHCIKSPDGGLTWQRLDGAVLSLPVVVDETGAGTMISEMSELKINTWLCNMLTKGGRTHFFYHGAHQAPYMNYDTASGARQNWRDFAKTGHVPLMPSDGFFATSGLDAASPLYAVMSDAAGRLAALESLDNGQSWHSFARAGEVHRPYSTGGSRFLTSDGFIVGTYTATAAPEGKKQVWFFKIDTRQNDSHGNEPSDKNTASNPTAATSGPGVQH